MKKNPFLFLIVTLLCSCNKNEIPLDITGTWKLTHVGIKSIPVTFPPLNYVSLSPFENYVQYNIFYEFRENGTLTISGETEQIDSYLGHEIGEYVYSVGQLREKSDWKILHIDENLYTFSFLDGSHWYIKSKGTTQIAITDSENRYFYALTKVK